MDRYKLSMLLALNSLVAMLIVVSVLNVTHPESTLSPALNAYVTAFGFFFSLVFSVSGLFLWLTGFRRFEFKIGKFGFKWFVYVAFNILSGIYMQFRYGSQINAANKSNQPGTPQRGAPV